MWDFLVASWPWLLAIVNMAMAAAVTVHAVLYKRDTRAVIGWVGLAWLAPLIGAFGYFCFGINRIQRKAVSLRFREQSRAQAQEDLQQQDWEQIEAFAQEHFNLVGLAQLGENLTGRSLLPGNSVRSLVNGDEAFPEMIDAINGASKSVALLSYIFDVDRSGEAFAEALSKAVQRGVEVRVLIDDVGSRYSRPNMVSQLQKRGVNATSFLPTRIPRLPTYANLRNHRKILVVDGEIAFTGGTNIREGHCLQLQPRFPVQCLHFRLNGPVVAQLQEVFAIDWAFASGESLSGDSWFPKLKRSGPVWARGIVDGPDEDFEKLADTMVGALAVARTRVRIVTPYFLPNSSLIQALGVAACRDVCVEIFLPSHNNIHLVEWAAMAQMWQILEKNCRVFRTAPPFDHTKLMVVDDVWSLIGSTNWDPRSLRLNFEFNVECYDADFANSLNDIIDHKAATASEISLDQVNSRSLPVRLRDGLARLFSPYL